MTLHHVTERERRGLCGKRQSLVGVWRGQGWLKSWLSNSYATGSTKGYEQSKNGIRTPPTTCCLWITREHVAENSLEGHLLLTLTVSGGEITSSIVFSLFICIF